MAKRLASGNNLVESSDKLIPRWWAEARNASVVDTQAAACLVWVRNTWRNPELGDQVVGNGPSGRCSGISGWIRCGSGRGSRRLRAYRVDLRSGRVCEILSSGDRSCCRSSGWLIRRALVSVMSPLGITRSERRGGESRCSERNKGKAILHGERLRWLKNGLG